MADEPQSRIAQSRSRAAAAKRAVAAAAAVAFVATLVLARASNPGEAAEPSTATDVPATVEDDDEDDGLDFGSPSIGPSGDAAPSVGTHAS